MLVKVFGAAVQGVDATIVTVEVNTSRGVKFFLVGLPDAAVKESHERIRAALLNTGYKVPASQFVISITLIKIFSNKRLKSFSAESEIPTSNTFFKIS